MFGKTRRSSPKEVDIDLNRVVTPMLDMTFQILFFLIMNFRLPSPEGQIDLTLPKEESSETSTAPPEEKLDKEKNDEYRLRLIVFRAQGDSQGSIAAMTWKPKESDAEPINERDPAEVNERDESLAKLDPKMYGLALKLREYQPKEGGKQPTIKIECDNKLRYSELLHVMDILRRLRFTNIGVMPIPKGK